MPGLPMARVEREIAHAYKGLPSLGHMAGLHFENVPKIEPSRQSLVKIKGHPCR